MKVHGKWIIEFATAHVKEDPTLRTMFINILSKIFDSVDSVRNAMDTVHDELLRKLCNTRLAEFIDCFREVEATKKSSATLSGQNLRDTLLSQHVNLKAHFLQQ